MTATDPEKVINAALKLKILNCPRTGNIVRSILILSDISKVNKPTFNVSPMGHNKQLLLTGLLSEMSLNISRMGKSHVIYMGL